MNELFQKLLALVDAFEPQFLLSAMLLGSLPASYDSLVAVLQSREEELTVNFVCSKVIDEFKRRKERNPEINQGNNYTSMFGKSTNHTKTFQE